MIVSGNPEYAEKMRRFRNHGISTDHRKRSNEGTWFYEMTDLGYNYRLTDFQCALGLSQLQKLSGWIERRREIAREYDIAFATLSAIKPLETSADSTHAYHLYVIRLEADQAKRGRAAVFESVEERRHWGQRALHPGPFASFLSQPVGYLFGDVFCGRGGVREDPFACLFSVHERSG